jgi:membrane fusion protein (multidrug efflux system)
VKRLQRSKRLPKAVIFLTLLAVTAYGCHKGQPSAGNNSHGQPTKLKSVTAVKPIRRKAVQIISLPGDLVGYYEVSIHSKVTGYLTEIEVDKGDQVQQGQTLARLHIPELNHNLKRVEAQEAIDRLTYQRLRQVQRKDARLISQETVDIAKSRYAEAAATVGVLRQLRDYTNIIAPFDGVITGRFADPGQLIRAGGGDLGISGLGMFVSPEATEGSGGHLTGGGPILTMARIDKLRIYVYVPEEQVSLVRVGMPAIINVRAIPGRQFHGRVVRFTHALDLSTRTMLTEVDVANPSGELYPRMYADVTLTSESREALELPPSAVGGLEGQPVNQTHHGFVYLVRNGILIKQPVTTGISDGRYVEILSNLKANQLVAEFIDASLTPGEHINPIVISEKTLEHEIGSPTERGGKA